MHASKELLVVFGTLSNFSSFNNSVKKYFWDIETTQKVDIFDGLPLQYSCLPYETPKNKKCFSYELIMRKLRFVIILIFSLLMLVCSQKKEYGSQSFFQDKQSSWKDKNKFNDIW